MIRDGKPLPPNVLDWLPELLSAVKGDPVIATASLDRPLHHCKVVNIKGHSYRLKEHKAVSHQLHSTQEELQTQNTQN